MQKPIIIGVTGAPGSGKTTVSKMLSKETGLKTIDADKIAWRLLKTKKIKKELSEAFGKDILCKGKISRKILAKKAFASANSVKLLNFTMHPQITRDIKKKLKSSFIIDAPLLIETGLHRECDYVVVVKCNKKIIEKRSKTYDTKERTKYHLPGKEKYADFVVDNNWTKNSTRKQIKDIVKKII